MTIRSGFFNSVEGDRKYNADDMNRPYKNLIANGVFPNPSTNLQVMVSSGMTIQILEGDGLFGNGWASNDSPILLPLSPGETNLNRIDAIVIARDTSEAVRTTKAYVKKGTPSSSPVAPTMIRNDYLNEYCLATVRVNSGTTSLSQSMITDTRPDTNVCGWVTGLIDQVDTSTLFKQWETAYEEQYVKNTEAFNAWFTNLQNILSDEESALAEIIRLGNYKADKYSQTASLTASGWSLSNGVYTQSISVSDVGAGDLIIVAPSADSAKTYATGEVYCKTQAENTLTFEAKKNVAVNVIIINMGPTV